MNGLSGNNNWLQDDKKIAKPSIGMAISSMTLSVMSIIIIFFGITWVAIDVTYGLYDGGILAENFYKIFNPIFLSAVLICAILSIIFGIICLVEKRPCFGMAIAGIVISTPATIFLYIFICL